MTAAATALPELQVPHRNGPARDTRASALAGFRARSRNVRFWRKALPAAMAAICLAILGWIGVRSVLAAFGDPGSATIRLLNPRLYGRDASGRSFRIEAKEAVRDGRFPDRFTLAAPGLMLDAGGNKSFKGSAARGVYDQHTRLLNLDGKVSLADGRGNSFLSDHAAIDLKKSLISGNSSVVGEGPLGRIAASSYAVYDQGERVVFSGGVRAHVLSQ